jgi:hydrogenase expression/formation protein HypE
MTLPPGKIPVDILKEVVFKNLGVKRDEIVIGPSSGIDCAVIDVGSKSLVVSMDPITGALEIVGYLAVNVNANDIATFGCQPLFLVSCILLPEKAEKKAVEIISSQMNEAAKDLGIAIIGGHCETTPGLSHPIVVGCMMGMTEKGKYVTAAGAKSGDLLILTKSAGIEGTAILATDREAQLKRVLGSRLLENAKGFYKQISVVKDAITAFKTGGVHAMHDPTEGGVAGAVHEMADASKLGVRISEDKIRVQRETLRICLAYDIDPLELIASGSLLVAADPDFAGRIIENLRKDKVDAEIIGEFLSSPEKRLITRKKGRVEKLQRPVTDQLWQALERSKTVQNR